MLGAVRKLLTLPLVAAAMIAAAGQAPAAGPRFAVVSIRTVRLNTSNGSIHGGELVDPTTWEARNANLYLLIAAAYGLRVSDINRLTGIPKSLDYTAFDIQARLPAQSRATDLPLMLQAMLATRFHLALHTEKRLMKAAAITVAAGGPKLTRDRACEAPDRAPEPVLRPAPGQAYAPSCGHWSLNGTSMNAWRQEFRGVSMPAFAEMESEPWLPVVDNTGLRGDYDFTLSYPTIPERGAPRDQWPVIEGRNLHARLQAFVNELGLRISLDHPDRERVTVYVVDHVGLPTPN